MENKNNNMVCLDLRKPENLDLEKLINPNQIYSISMLKNGKVIIVKYSGVEILKHIPLMYYFIHKLIELQYSGVNNKKPQKASVRLYSDVLEPFDSELYFIKIRNILEHLDIINIYSFEVNSRKSKNGKTNGYHFMLKDPYFDAKIIQHQIYIDNFESFNIIAA